jgi:hypothetical protein
VTGRLDRGSSAPSAGVQTALQLGVTLVTVSTDDPTSGNDTLSCVACGSRLLPLSYAIPPHDDPRGPDRAALKCVGCGRRFQVDLNDWGPSGGV